jgi:transposase
VAARQTFADRTLRTLDPGRLVFLDESGFKPNLTRRCGWAPVGQRPVITASRYGQNLTVIGAIATDGVRALRSVRSKFDGPAFKDYLDTCLGPKLRKGDIVVMDGPRLHKVQGVVEVLARWGATPLYLPAYSPEYNPIEMCWSWMKALVRTRIPGTMPRLVATVEEAWHKLTTDLCAGWISHCGYATQRGSI